MKFRSIALASLVSVFMLASCGKSGSEKMKTVAQVHQNKAALAGQTIEAQGKVIKANNGILGYNFIHIQDGTTAGSDDKLIIRSKQTADVGSEVKISGTVVVDRDFGSGYMYPLLIEEATVTPKQ
jgi:hypothetical protein